MSITDWSVLGIVSFRESSKQLLEFFLTAISHFLKEEVITGYAGESCSLEEVETMRGKVAHDYVILPTLNGIRQVDKPYWLGIMTPEVGKGLGSFINAPHDGQSELLCVQV